MDETGRESKGGIFNVPNGFRRGRGRIVTILGIIVIVSLIVGILGTLYRLIFQESSILMDIILLSISFSCLCAWIFLYSIMHTSRLSLMLLHMLVAFGRSPDEIVAVLKDLRRILESEKSGETEAPEGGSTWVQQVRNKQKRKE